MNFFRKIIVLFFIYLLSIQPIFAFLSIDDLEKEITGYENEIIIDEDLIPSEDEIFDNILDFSQIQEEEFPFDIKFQNPSYILNKDVLSDEIFCDDNYDECKINFKFTESGKQTISSKYECFLSLSWATEQRLDNCNPNTLIFSEWITHWEIKIREKEFPEIFYFKRLKITSEKNKWLDNGTETNTGIWEEKGDYKILFQNPSYLIDKSVEKNEYYCDSTKGECKVNLNIWWKDWTALASENKCFISFSDKNIKSISSCNPKTVIFTEKSTDVSFLIQLWDKSVRKQIIIHKTDEIKEKPTNSTDVIENNTWDQNSEIIIPKNFEIQLDIQSGISKGWDDIFRCEKEDCSVNLDVSDSFTWTTLEQNYTCLWDFWTWATYKAGTENKCNPWYVKTVKGSTQTFTVQIMQKTNSQIIREAKYVILPYIHKAKVLKTWPSSSSNEKNYKIFATEIEIQSGLNENWECIKSECKINLQYDSTSYEQCYWDFESLQNTYSKFIENCNPGFMDIPTGNYVFQLQVQNNRSWNRETKTIYIKNNIKWELEWVWSKPELILQWKKLDYRKQDGNNFYCIGITKCSINLELINSGENTILNWHFGNWEIFTGSNPKSYWFEEGIYKWHIKIKDESSEELIETINFTIHVDSWKTIIEQDTKLKSIDYYRNIQIYSVIPNPIWPDSKEYIILKNIWENEINLSGLILDDIRKGGSKPYVFKDILIQPGTKLKIDKQWSGISLHNSQDSVFILYNWEIIDSISWNKAIWEGENVFHWNEIQKVEEIIKTTNPMNWKKIELTANWIVEEKNKIIKSVFQKKIWDIPKISLWKKNQANKKPRLTKNIQQQKKAIKIYWLTEPEAIVYLEAQWKIFEFHADDIWKYQMKMDQFPSWNYKINYNLLLKSGELILDAWKKEVSISNKYLASLQDLPPKKEEILDKKKEKPIAKEKSLLQTVPDILSQNLPAKGRYNPEAELVPNYLYCLYFIFTCIGLYFVWRKNNFWKKNNLAFLENTID